MYRLTPHIIYLSSLWKSEVSCFPEQVFAFCPLFLIATCIFLSWIFLLIPYSNSHMLLEFTTSCNCEFYMNDRLQLQWESVFSCFCLHRNLIPCMLLNWGQTLVVFLLKFSELDLWQVTYTWINNVQEEKEIYLFCFWI